MKCLAPGCNNKARVKFCSNKCKDRYHNINNPRGKFAHLKRDRQFSKDPLFMDPYDAIDEYHDSLHPFSGEALGQD